METPGLEERELQTNTPTLHFWALATQLLLK